MFNSPSVKSYFSPFKPKGNEIQAVATPSERRIDDCLNTPSQDRFRNFWLPNLDSTNWKSLKYPKLKNTPLSKEYVKPFMRGTPKRDIRDAYDDVSQENENAFISPKFKELSFGKDVMNGVPVGRSPMVKQSYGTPLQASEFLDDDITKAEFSNLFSNKSNHIGNL